MAQPPRFVVSTVAAARRRLYRLADALVPAEVALLDKSFSLVTTHVLGVIAELGVADLLAKGPRTAAQMATELGVDTGALHRVLRAGAALDVLSLDRAGRFRLTRLGRPLRSDHPRSARTWPRFASLRSMALSWVELLESVRTGDNAFGRVHGRSVWAHFAEQPEEGRLFNQAMRRWSEMEVPGLVAAYPWPDQGTVCDVAGGVGAVLAGVLAARPELRGVLVDAPEVLPAAEDYLTGTGVRDRVELTSGDIFAQINATADVYVLKDVLHSWTDAACATILGTIRATAGAGSRIVVVESTLDHTQVDPVAIRVDLLMLLTSEGGRQRSVRELQDLLAAAGFTPSRVYPTSGVESLVEAIAT